MGKETSGLSVEGDAPIESSSPPGSGGEMNEKPEGTPGPWRAVPERIGSWEQWKIVGPIHDEIIADLRRSARTQRADAELMARAWQIPALDRVVRTAKELIEFLYRHASAESPWKPEPRPVPAHARTYMSALKTAIAEAELQAEPTAEQLQRRLEDIVEELNDAASMELQRLHPSEVFARIRRIARGERK